MTCKAQPAIDEHQPEQRQPLIEAHLYVTGPIIALPRDDSQRLSHVDAVFFTIPASLLGYLLQLRITRVAKQEPNRLMWPIAALHSRIELFGFLSQLRRSDPQEIERIGAEPQAPSVINTRWNLLICANQTQPPKLVQLAPCEKCNHNKGSDREDQGRIPLKVTIEIDIQNNPETGDKKSEELSVNGIVAV
jgi:hypothetical protein